MAFLWSSGSLFKGSMPLEGWNLLERGVMVYDRYVTIFMHRDILCGDWMDCLCMGRCVIGLRVEAAYNFYFLY